MRRYLFTVLEGPDIGRVFELKVGRTIVGRLESAHGADQPGVERWTLIDKTVSRNHAEISLADPGVPILRHLSATNGSYVNGRLVKEENLQEGQVLQFGQTVLVMEVVDPPRRSIPLR